MTRPLASVVVAVAIAAGVVAAPVPPEGKEVPKPRAKLVGTLKLDRRVEQVVWTADGKHLIAFTADKGLVIGRDQLGDEVAPKPVAEFDLPAGGGSKFGLTPDGTEVYALTTAGTRLNAETRLCFWAVKDLVDGKKKAKPDRVVCLEADNPSGVEFAADGKSVYAVVSRSREGAGLGPDGTTPRTGRVVRLSAKTGDVAEEVAAVDDPDGTFVGAVVHPASGRVFTHTYSQDHTVRCVDTATRKEKWERAVEATAPAGGGPPVLSPDGKVLAVACPRQVQLRQHIGPGQPPRFTPFHSARLHLLNADTGDAIAELSADDAHSAAVCGFSADGRLAFGWVYRYSGTQYSVWETKTGTAVKTWERGSGDVAAAFAPAAAELAIVERIQAHQWIQPRGAIEVVVGDTPAQVYADQNVRVVQTGQASVIGVWDLTAPAK